MHSYLGEKAMMVENSFNKALREVISGEFSNIPLHEAEIPHTFSNGFLRKMDKLTKAEKNRFWRMTSTAPKRFAVIMASLLIITLTACSIPPVRAAVVGFIKETYDNCIRLFTGEAGSKRISEHYVIAELPYGFTEINWTETDPMYITHYQNVEGDEIILTQSITDQFSLHMDNEHGTISEINLSGMNITIYESDNCIVAVWLQDRYAFDLTVYGDYDMDFIIKLVGAVKRQ